MSKRRRAPDSEPTRGQWAERLAALALAGAVLAAALLVDPRAEAAFDAPKRLATLTLTAFAAVLAFAFACPVRCRLRWREIGRAHQSIVLLATFVAVAALVSALLSRRAMALDDLRAMALLGLLLPLGASRVLAGGRGRLVLVAFLSASCVNVAVSLLQKADLFTPFALEWVAGRSAAVGLVGNEGVLALSLALAAVAGAAVSLGARSRRAKTGALAVTVVCTAGVAAAASLTAILTLGAGLALLGMLALPRRWRLLAATAAVVAAIAAGLGPLRLRVLEVNQAIHEGRWSAITSYRAGPWAAALEMALDRPLVGRGPGSFATDFAPARVAAEMRWRAHLANPIAPGGYDEAHSDLLQAAAELGIPAALAAVAAFALLLAALGRTAQGSRRAEAVFLLVVLAAGGLAALTWFPLAREVTAVPLLLAAGRAWRVSLPPGPAAGPGDEA